MCYGERGQRFAPTYQLAHSDLYLTVIYRLPWLAGTSFESVCVTSDEGKGWVDGERGVC